MPTRANITKNLCWLAQDARPGDALFLSFAGHGAQQEDPHGYEEDGMNETILPVDFERAGMMSDDELADLVTRHLPEGVKLTCVMDCCHSGTGLDLPYTWKGRSGWREETNPYHCLADVQMFSGCEDDDTSSDASTAYGAAGGAMTTAFCNALRSNPSPTYLEMMSTLHHNLRRDGFQQEPQLTSSQPFEFDRHFMLSDAIPNMNPQIGRIFRRRFPPRPRKREGPLARTRDFRSKKAETTPGALELMTGDWGDYRRKEKNMIIVLLACSGTLSLPLAMLDIVYAKGVMAFVFGVLYLTLPADISDLMCALWRKDPDDAAGARSPWGCADNVILGVLPILWSFYYFYGLHRHKILALFISLLILMALSKGLRFLFVGLWAMLGQFTLWSQVIPSYTLAFGISLYSFGFIYNSLQVDFIPDSKTDNVVFGYGPVVGGIAVFAVGVLAFFLI
jgi:hypothetical protein